MAYYLSKVWFEVAGGNYRWVVAFDFRRQVAFVKFIGTHSEYDRIDPLTGIAILRETTYGHPADPHRARSQSCAG